jgi:pimeloyl-ACP methyl ester carboxylesterase
MAAPLNIIEDRVPDSRALMVLLPGAGDAAGLYARHGFIEEARRAGWPGDLLAVDAYSDLYLDKSALPRLHAEVIAPELAARPRPLWLTGISLGGMGACEYARLHPGDVAGLLLMAPFLAVRGTIAQVTRAGGLAAWQPHPAELQDEERALLHWIKQWPRGKVEGAQVPPAWLGYGLQDRYAPASSLMAACLRDAQVLTAQGGHDWPTWQALWPRLLAASQPAWPRPAGVPGHPAFHLE